MVKSDCKTVAIIQARMGSQRLPGKVMLPLGRQTILGWVIERVRLALLVDEIWLATSINAIDDVVADEGKKKGVYVFRGSETDVLDRFYQVTLISKPDVIVRVTADNPFTYYEFINKAIDTLSNKNCDYVDFVNIPLGSGVEVIKSKALQISAQKATMDSEREHVTLYVINNPHIFTILKLKVEPKMQRPEIRLTVDTEEDYILAKAIYFFLGKDCNNLEKIISLLDEQPWLKNINRNISQKSP